LRELTGPDGDLQKKLGSLRQGGQKTEGRLDVGGNGLLVRKKIRMRRGTAETIALGQLKKENSKPSGGGYD